MNKLITNWREWHWYHWLLILLALVLPIGQLQRISIGDLGLYPFELLLVGWVVGYFLNWRSELITFVSIFLEKLRTSRFWWAIVIVVGLGWLGAGANGNLTVLTGLYLLRFSTYAVWGWTVLRLLQHQKLLQNPLFTAPWLPWLTGILVAWFGMWQYLLLPDTRFLAILGWDDHLGRLISSPLDPGFTGLWLIFSFFLSLQLPLQKFKIPILLFLFTALVLTYSRASYLTLGISAAFYWLKFAPTKFVTKKIIVSIFLVLTLTLSWLIFRPYGGEGTLLTRTSTIQARLINSTADLNSLQPVEFIWGKGLFVEPNQYLPTNQNQAKVANHARFTDNLIVSIFTQTGLLGLIVVAIGILQIGNKWRKLPLLQTLLLALLLHSQFHASVSYAFTLVVFIWTVVLEMGQKPIES